MRCACSLRASALCATPSSESRPTPSTYGIYCIGCCDPEQPHDLECASLLKLAKLGRLGPATRGALGSCVAAQRWKRIAGIAELARNFGTAALWQGSLGAQLQGDAGIESCRQTVCECLVVIHRTMVAPRRGQRVRLHVKIEWLSMRWDLARRKSF